MEEKVEKIKLVPKFIRQILDKSEVITKKGDNMIESVKLVGEIHLVLKNKDGDLREDRLIKNTITTVGKAQLVRLMLADITGTAFDYMAIGIGTASATALGSESTTNGGARRGGADVVGTVQTTTLTDDTAQWVTTFTFTGALAITEEGIFNASAAGTMLASQSFAVLNVANGDTLQVNHKIKVA